MSHHTLALVCTWYLLVVMPLIVSVCIYVEARRAWRRQP